MYLTMPQTENGMRFINTAAEEAGSYREIVGTHSSKRLIFNRLLRREIFILLKEDDGSNEILIICFLVSYIAVRNKKVNEKRITFFAICNA